ncbi:uncharacterized protein KNAG_0C06150 [Huiozyma naganishii CBS 8797]|uniref:UspA domain-containing protein n=1 Tax=Huiozyma naganishii (strain ATCC MYA-139 / BCRC 22969 / CBS 8797 / KCTC 17520 / NBRC 10181 / NCYC 3082 / Yp74L-3) TaxID=1071383 RepID=J7S6E5_HUIN7|nr:hypothetical protein KNAG_0C06150 [Kazachstania naganishii CBS 8797]CCK69711.1 hypothetical protein KNAG_0C06150 [Kazachstania naganishii CBS 8797]
MCPTIFLFVCEKFHREQETVSKVIPVVWLSGELCPVSWSMSATGSAAGAAGAAVMKPESVPGSDAYRHLKLNPDEELLREDIGYLYPRSSGSGERPPKSALLDKALKKNYPYLSLKPCVSFNTVPLTSSRDKLLEKHYEGYDFPGVQMPNPSALVPDAFTMDEWYDNECGSISESSVGTQYPHRHPQQTRKSRLPGSPPSKHTALSPQALQKMFKIAENGKIVREDYPSRPSIVSDCLVVNRAYGDWHELWLKKKLLIEDKVDHRDTVFTYPQILSPPPPKRDPLDSKSLNMDGYTPLTKEQKRKLKIMSEKTGYAVTPRSILCHISGRKHTWVALDYTIDALAKDTDHIIVVANLPKFRIRRRSEKSKGNKSESRSSSRSRSRGRSLVRTRSVGGSDHEEDNAADDDLLQRTKSLDVHNIDELEEELLEEWTSGYDKNTIIEKMNDLLFYIFVLLSKSKKSIKVTVEIVIGKSRDVLQDMYNVYTPDLFVLSKKGPSSQIEWKSKLLVDNFVTTAPTPVIVVAAKAMSQFELKVQAQFLAASTVNEDAPLKGKFSLASLDRVVNKSIVESQPLIADRPKAKVRKSMIEVALSHSKQHSHSSSPSLSQTRASMSPLRNTLPTKHFVEAGHSSRTLSSQMSPTPSIDASFGSSLSPVRSGSGSRQTSPRGEHARSGKRSGGTALRKVRSNETDDRGSSENQPGFFSALWKTSSTKPTSTRWWG